MLGEIFKTLWETFVFRNKMRPDCEDKKQDPSTKTR